MIAFVLISCVQPLLVESTEPTLNPGEPETLALYEGAGILGAYSCTVPASLSLESVAGGAVSWPYLLAERELVFVDILVGYGATEGDHSCTIETIGSLDVLPFTLVVL